jgi:hypothetical protein
MAGALRGSCRRSLASGGRPFESDTAHWAGGGGRRRAAATRTRLAAMTTHAGARAIVEPSEAVRR